MKTLLTLCFLQVVGVIQAGTNPWISATDEESIRQEGVWTESSFRYAIADSMATQEDGAAHEFELLIGIRFFKDFLSVRGSGRD